MSAESNGQRAAQQEPANSAEALGDDAPVAPVAPDAVATPQQERGRKSGKYGTSRVQLALSLLLLMLAIAWVISLF